MTKRNPGTPQSLAISAAAASKTVVSIGTAGMPFFSSMIASSKLPDEQAPQSPMPAMAKSVFPRSSSIWASSSGARCGLRTSTSSVIPCFACSS
jgi:hypothetical protein